MSSIANETEEGEALYQTCLVTMISLPCYEKLAYAAHDAGVPTPTFLEISRPLSCGTPFRFFVGCSYRLFLAILKNLVNCSIGRWNMHDHGLWK